MSESGIELQRMTIDADKGLNYLSYNLELSEKGRRALLKANDGLKLDKASNDKYYLPKGSYEVRLDDSSTPLEIK
jgi:hypothetical protein